MHRAALGTFTMLLGLKKMRQTEEQLTGIHLLFHSASSNKG
jgi:hypothetical protein